MKRIIALFSAVLLFAGCINTINLDVDVITNDVASTTAEFSIMVNDIKGLSSINVVVAPVSDPTVAVVSKMTKLSESERASFAGMTLKATNLKPDTEYVLTATAKWGTRTESKEVNFKTKPGVQ